ncbi:hypothetical protein SAMN05216588_10543 [Pseudomonas flavescens]|uniref:Uncharacterized protein n=1 Tax=Phytopseudomonas flavescens TaxID=29435 RepID=A0A1G8CUT7_9GAMM|nr:hypothetical protein SAMN05216588_10543 [Pseudomonas flavescens]
MDKRGDEAVESRAKIRALFDCQPIVTHDQA